MAVLDRKHPVVARFKKRGQAIALVKRTLNRQLSDAELSLFNANDLLAGITPHDDRATRQILLDTLAKDQTADDTELATEAGKIRAKANDSHALMVMHAAQREHGNTADDELAAKRAAMLAKLAELNAELLTVVSEISRRERVAELLKKVGAVTDTDKAMLAQILSPDTAAPSTRVGNPGT